MTTPICCFCGNFIPGKAHRLVDSSSVYCNDCADPEEDESVCSICTYSNCQCDAHWDSLQERD